MTEYSHSNNKSTAKNSKIWNQQQNSYDNFSFDVLNYIFFRLISSESLLYDDIQ